MPLTRRSLLSAAICASVARSAALSEVPLAITTDEIDEDLTVAAAFLRRFNLNLAEIRSLWGQYNTAQPIPKIEEARRILDAHQIKLAVLDTGVYKIPLPPEGVVGERAVEEQLKILDAAMERAAILGTNTIRTFAFTTPKGQPAEGSAYPRIFKLVRLSARRAADKGYRLALENVGGSYVSTAAQAARLLSEVKEPNLGLTWDPNNSAASGGKSYPDGYRLLDPARIFHVHLRDYRQVNDKVEWCAVGEGEFDHVGQIRALMKDGYKGTFSLETHFTVDGNKTKATERSLAELLKRIEKV